VLASVKQNGMALMYACKDLQSEREVVLAAVKQCSQAMAYASKELQNDRDMRKTVRDTIRREKGNSRISPSDYNLDFMKEAQEKPRLSSE